MPPSSTFLVEPYSIERLTQLIADCSPRPEPISVAAKAHMRYFASYFAPDGVNAQTILVEQSYTDRAYLEDYSAFYVRCLDRYKSRCTRLHFFSTPFTQEDIDALAAGELNPTAAIAFEARNESGVSEYYLGFVVVRPLHRALIGRTCLATYGNDGGRRNFPVTRTYDVNLLGYPLQVRSLAFQEQDQAAAACATSTLWTTFHGTAKLFQHSIYSPSEITRFATNKVQGFSRTFPNHGLNALQMASAIESVGLAPEPIYAPTPDLLQGISYGYLKAGIPLPLLASMHDASDPANVQPFDENDPDTGHALAITGFSLGAHNCIPAPRTGTLFRHTKIDKLYCHDDQVGPFAKMPFAGPLATPTEEISRYSLKSSWEEKRDIRFVPEAIILPLYHKIRISYIVALGEIIALDDDIQFVEQDRGRVLPERLEWDVFLTTSSQFKSELRSDRLIMGSRLSLILTEPLPRFIWRAIARSAGRYIMEQIFDATDVETGDFAILQVFYNDRFERWFTTGA